MEPVIRQAQKLGFEKGWLVALQDMWVPQDFPLRNPNQIPFSDPSPPVQNPSGAVDEKKTTSMRELVRAIDSYVELVVLEVTNNLRADDQPNKNIPI